MAIVQMSSKNPYFSFMIKKNPQSGLSVRSVRKGVAYGWYTNETTYNVYFKDADNDISYKQSEDEHFEYLNVSRYNTPLFPLHAIGEFFSAPLKAQDARDTEGYEHSFFINMIHIELIHYIDFFSKHLPEYSFELTHLSHKSYSLRVTTRKSMHELLHVVHVLCLFLAMFGKEYIDISENILDKYVKSMQVIDAPFYIRSLFARNFLTSRDRFKKYKEALEASARYAICFDFGNTAQQRRSYIANLLPFNKPIVDIGCGEGFYAIPFAKKIEECYYAIDTNQEALQITARKAEKKEMENVIPFPSLDHFLAEYNSEKVDVILTEVIEHMSEEDARQLILQIVQNVDFDTFILTTPNADFNAFYEICHFRHEDHKWEMGEKEFQTWFLTFMPEELWHIEFVSIGDAVNGVRTTQGVLLKRKGGSF
ncbi:class I SAM-dependent methyltransferase [Brevibacillus nitrificans]|uniref:class I SAM-dependent methyltransferase n=1 Tax=Brevibacillus nitrificans TaxID=651560 RepID=UPI002E1C4E1A|nr:class I SAM-dependent methyltransferase [Brevibacillus nitrificans]